MTKRLGNMWRASCTKATMRELHRISHPFRHIKWFWQRGTRGWADCDVWSLDNYLSKILAGALLELADNTHGHLCRMMETETSKFPDCCNTCKCEEIWEAELRENAERFRLLYEDEWYKIEPLKKAWAEEEKTYTEATQWLAKNFGALWD